VIRGREKNIFCKEEDRKRKDERQLKLHIRGKRNAKRCIRSKS
jgi:hypothetical protein